MDTFGVFHLLVVVVSVSTSEALVRKGVLPHSVQACYDNYPRVSLRSVVGQQFCHFCEDKAILTERSPDYPMREDESSRLYIQHLVHKLDEYASPVGGRKKRQVFRRRCRRREYRTLSDVERTQFHNAINALKRDFSVWPNKFDAVAGLHAGVIANAAHGGANFLGFHRILILILEIALQEVNPRVCLPYWDSSMDDELDFPAESPVFGPSFMGGRGGGGLLTNGPFRNWVTPWHGPLMRNIGATGRLFPAVAVRNILSQRNTIDITPPLAALDNSLEFNHNGVHNFIGGQMIPTASSAHDPIFFLHHCFVDYLWETFRTRQRTLGINPDFDYPTRVSSMLHLPTANLGFNLNWTASFAYSSIFTSSYVYEPSPECNRIQSSCRSRHLRCQRGRCIPIERGFRSKRAATSNKPADTTSTHIPNAPTVQHLNAPIPGSSITEPLDAPITRIHQTPETPKCRDGIKPIQNTFCVDGRCDVKRWVYVAVKVVTLRPPDFKDYHSYPIVNGHLSNKQDIYAPTAYQETGKFCPPIGQAPMGYHRCKANKGVGQVFVQTQGINYEGFYKESAVVDQRLPTSMAVAYVAVKKPTRGPVKALFRAFDACGRICQPGCKVSGTDQYEMCSGALEILDVPGKPRQYSYDYGQAAANTWVFDKNFDFPRLNNDDVPITFYCNYKPDMPWAKRPSHGHGGATGHGAAPGSVNPSSQQHRSIANNKGTLITHSQSQAFGGGLGSISGDIYHGASSQHSQGGPSSHFTQGGVSSQYSQGGASSMVSQGGGSSPFSQGGVASQYLEGGATSMFPQGGESSLFSQGGELYMFPQGGESAQFLQGGSPSPTGYQGEEANSLHHINEYQAQSADSSGQPTFLDYSPDLGHDILHGYDAAILPP